MVAGMDTAIADTAAAVRAPTPATPPAATPETTSPEQPPSSTPSSPSPAAPQPSTAADVPASVRNGLANGDPNLEAMVRDGHQTRERIAGSPLVAGGVLWADDGRVAVVSEASIVISTFRSRELEMYIQHSPAISKSFIFLPEATAAKTPAPAGAGRRERVPLPIPVFREPRTTSLPPNAVTCFLLHEHDRHQYNPKELSLSKNDGVAFLAATWGPRGSGPNSSCALLALTASGRISLHFSSSFHLSWREVAVFSDSIVEFLESRQWTLSRADEDKATTNGPKKHAATLASGEQVPEITAPALKVAKTKPLGKKRKREAPSSTSTMTMTEYARRCALVSTLSIAWSPFLTNLEQHTTSLIAFSGRAITTVWGYDYPSFEALTATEAVAAGSSARGDSDGGSSTSLLSSTPFAWIDTEKHGWVTTSTWQCMHRQPGQHHAELRLAMGTSSGNVLLALVPVMPRDVHVTQVAIDRVIVTPSAQPVFGLRLGSRSTYGNSKRLDLIVASGSRLSVWDLHKKRGSATTWKAHAGNITGLDVDYFGNKIFSCGVDGIIRLWDKATGKELPFVPRQEDGVDAATAAPIVRSQHVDPGAKYPMYGLSMSPNSAQIACMYVIPPAARPNRKSQADVSYSRVSCALEYLPTPYAALATTFVQTICQILEESRDMSTMMDVLWLCHEDNAAITSVQGSSDLTIPHLVNKLKGVRRASVGEAPRQPLYLSLCEELERRSTEATGVMSDGRPLFLQAAFLLRSCIDPAENHSAIQAEALAKVKRALYVYWAERCLKELLASHSQIQNFADITKSERISALLMADFLSVQEKMSDASERLVTTIYNRLGSEENVGRWSTYLQERVQVQAESRSGESATVVRPVAPVPPPRQTCYICDEPVPFSELEPFCVSGHVQDRCFLSFQVLSSMDTWKCMGCGAAACELDFSRGRSPFYLLESHSKSTRTMSGAGMLQIECRLCGNYCSFLRY